MISTRVHLAVAALIALVAFATGQTFPGMGMPFGAIASTLWVAWAVRRRGKAAIS